VGNWTEQRLDPNYSQGFSGNMMPTAYANTYRTTYSEATKGQALKQSAQSKHPEDRIIGGTDPLSAQERYCSVAKQSYRDPKVIPLATPALPKLSPSQLQSYIKTWTSGDALRFNRGLIPN